jgi:hypothetical protein
MQEGKQQRDEPDDRDTAKVEANDAPGAKEGEADDEPGAREEAAAAIEPLAEGSTLSLGFAEVPTRSLAAMAIFVGVFMVAWMILWAAAGGIGLGLGWILAAGLGALAVKLYADRVR